MTPLPIEAVSSIKDQKSFFAFLNNYLAWPIKEEIDFEDATYYWDTSEFGYDKSYFKGSSIYQLRPFVQDQPWGIFILHLTSPKIFISELKNILRSLCPSIRKLRDYPTWKPNHLLFICTYDWKNYTFAHFDGDKPQSAKLSTFSWEYNSSYLRTVCEYNLSSLQMPENLDLFGDVDSTRWIKNWSEAFSIKKVTDKFFVEMVSVFNTIQEKYISGVKGENKRSFTQLLINRLLFLKFLEKKGWLFVDESDNEAARKNYLNRQFINHKNSNMWENFFYHLFFRGLNRKYNGGVSEYPESLRKLIGYVPFLNGGLFQETIKSDDEKSWNDKEVNVDNKAFELIFNTLLNAYNFTIEENTPLDIEVALNPDLLGNAYEELIAERHGQGAYYTHPIEVGLMCRESLKTYLTEHTKTESLSIAKLVDFYSSEDLTDTEAFEIYKLLTTIKILDPAIGSGAYPVRMMQELVHIHQSLAKKIISGPLGRIVSESKIDPDNRYQFKLDIIRTSIYGADIDHFAVEIAKLRFWLSLVVDYDIIIKSYDDLNSIPALPNLDFKLRTGDSLIAKVKKGKSKDGKAGYNLDLMFQHNQMDAFFEEPIRKLAAMKNNYFNFELIKDKRKVSKELLKKEIEELEKNLAKEIGITEIETFKGINHILWQIHFAEIFDENLNFGFDICIANPPYLRQEKINELFKTFESGVTKDELVAAYENLFSNKKIKIDKKSDLYVYFFLRGVNLLKEKGILCFICSNSWLDVGYGKALQEILLKTSMIKTIYDNSAKRSFEKADVNTTINVFIKDSSVDFGEGNQITGRKKELSTKNIVRFVVFKDEFEKTALSSDINNINKAEEITSSPNWRVYPISQNELYQSALDENLNFEGDKWGGKFLRAPDIFFTILEKGRKKFIPLKQIAKFNFGIKSGVNEFFYFDKSREKDWAIEKKFLKLILKSPRECKFIKINTDILPNKIIICTKKKSELKNTELLKYINWGEKQKTEDGVNWNDVPSVGGRELWYAIEENFTDDFIIPRTFNDIYICHYGGINFSDRFYGIVSKEKRLITFFNSTLFVLFAESLAKQGLGLGALDLNIREFVKIPVLVDFPKTIVIDREIKSVFEECGFNKTKPIRSQKPNPLSDRKALDDLVFDALDLNKAEREEVYYAVCELVQNRLNKARSV